MPPCALVCLTLTHHYWDIYCASGAFNLAILDQRCTFFTHVVSFGVIEMFVSFGVIEMFVRTWASVLDDVQLYISQYVWDYIYHMMIILHVCLWVFSAAFLAEFFVPHKFIYLFFVNLITIFILIIINFINAQHCNAISQNMSFMLPFTILLGYLVMNFALLLSLLIRNLFPLFGRPAQLHYV